MTITTATSIRTSASATGWRTHYTLLMLLFVYTMSVIDRQIMGILIQPIKMEFKVSDSAMGLLTGLAFALFYSALAVPFGRFADRTNRRNFIAYCCVAWSAMTTLCGMATGYWTVAPARAGVAVGQAGGHAPAPRGVPSPSPPDEPPPRLRRARAGRPRPSPPAPTLPRSSYHPHRSEIAPPKAANCAPPHNSAARREGPDWVRSASEGRAPGRERVGPR